MEETKQETCWTTVNRIILGLEHAEKDGTNISGILSGLRKSIGRNPDDCVEVWSFLLEEVPKEFLSQNGIPTYQENAIITALQLYSLSRQGAVNNVTSDPASKYNIGRSLSEGRKLQGDSAALDKRFNAMTISENFETVVYRLRQLLKLVESQTVMTVNFGKLAEDLFWYQKGQRDRVRFRWAEGYYGNYDMNQTDD